MKEFMGKDFLLSNETAKHLYHDYAEKMPIIGLAGRRPLQVETDACQRHR